MLLLAAAIRLSEAAGAQEAPNPILPATNEIIYGTVSFLILFLIMWKFAYPAVKKGMVARSARIESTLSSADKALAEASALLMLQKKVDVIWGNGREDAKGRCRIGNRLWRW